LHKNLLILLPSPRALARRWDKLFTPVIILQTGVFAQ
jgi:hypothetical protein